MGVTGDYRDDERKPVIPVFVWVVIVLAFAVAILAGAVLARHLIQRLPPEQ